MQNLTVDWRYQSQYLLDCIHQWLRLINLEYANDKDLSETLNDTHVVIPHHLWVSSGFSGSSVPPTIVIDYRNSIIALTKREDTGMYLTQLYQKEKLLDLEKNVVHFGKGNERLCGRADIMIPDKLTTNIKLVTCPHCTLEVMTRIPAGSGLIN